MKKAPPPELTGRRRLSSISTIEINMVSSSHASQISNSLQAQNKQLVVDILGMAKRLLLAAKEIQHLLQAPPLSDPTKTQPRKDWLYIHKQIENIQSYFISDLVGGSKEASESEKQARLERFKEICISTNKLEVLTPTPLAGEDNTDTFTRGFLRTNASGDGTQGVKEAGYPIAKLVERHPDTWWSEQMSHVLLRAEETRSATEAKFSYRELYEGVLTEIIKKLCAQHPAYKQHQHNLAFSGLDKKFLELLEFTGKTFKYHPDILSYFKSLKPENCLPQFEDLDAYTYTALEELIPNIVTVEQDSVRLLKDLRDIIKTIDELILPKLEGVLGVKIDTQDIKELLAELDRFLVRSPYRLYLAALSRDKNFDALAVLKTYPIGSITSILDRFMLRAGKDDVQLLLVKKMHPANIAGPLTEINQVTHNVGVIQQLTMAQIGTIKKIVGWVDHGNEFTYARTTSDENGFSRLYDRLIEKYNEVYSASKVEEKASQTRQRKDSADQSVSPPPSSAIRVSVEGLVVSSTSKTRARSISRVSGEAPGFFTGLDGTLVKSDSLSPRKSANNSPRTAGSASNSPRTLISANRSPRSHVTSPAGSPRAAGVPGPGVPLERIDGAKSPESVLTVAAIDAAPSAAPLEDSLLRKHNSPQLRERKSKGSLRTRMWAGKSLADPAMAVEPSSEIAAETKPKNPLSRSSSLPKFAGGEIAIAKLFKRPGDGGDKDGANKGINNPTMK
jgi:hypothetical protein